MDDLIKLPPALENDALLNRYQTSENNMTRKYSDDAIDEAWAEKTLNDDGLANAELQYKRITSMNSVNNYYLKHYRNNIALMQENHIAYSGDPDTEDGRKALNDTVIRYRNEGGKDIGLMTNQEMSEQLQNFQQTMLNEVDEKRDNSGILRRTADYIGVGLAHWLEETPEALKGTVDALGFGNDSLSDEAAKSEALSETVDAGTVVASAIAGAMSGGLSLGAETSAFAGVGALSGMGGYFSSLDNAKAYERIAGAKHLTHFSSKGLLEGASLGGAEGALGSLTGRVISGAVSRFLSNFNGEFLPAGDVPEFKDTGIDFTDEAKKYGANPDGNQVGITRLLKHGTTQEEPFSEDRLSFKDAETPEVDPQKIFDDFRTRNPQLGDVSQSGGDEAVDDNEVTNNDDNNDDGEDDESTPAEDKRAPEEDKDDFSSRVKLLLNEGEESFKKRLLLKDEDSLGGLLLKRDARNILQRLTEENADKDNPPLLSRQLLEQTANKDGTILLERDPEIIKKRLLEQKYNDDVDKIRELSLRKKNVLEQNLNKEKERALERERLLEREAESFKRRSIERDINKINKRLRIRDERSFKKSFLEKNIKQMQKRLLKNGEEAFNQRSLDKERLLEQDVAKIKKRLTSKAEDRLVQRSLKGDIAKLNRALTEKRTLLENAEDNFSKRALEEDVKKASKSLTDKRSSLEAELDKINKRLASRERLLAEDVKKVKSRLSSKGEDFFKRRLLEQDLEGFQKDFLAEDVNKVKKAFLNQDVDRIRESLLQQDVKPTVEEPLSFEDLISGEKNFWIDIDKEEADKLAKYEAEQAVPEVTSREAYIPKSFYDEKISEVPKLGTDVHENRITTKQFFNTRDDTTNTKAIGDVVPYRSGAEVDKKLQEAYKGGFSRYFPEKKFGQFIDKDEIEAKNLDTISKSKAYSVANRWNEAIKLSELDRQIKFIQQHYSNPVHAIVQLAQVGRVAEEKLLRTPELENAMSEFLNLTDDEFSTEFKRDFYRAIYDGYKGNQKVNNAVILYRKMSTELLKMAEGNGTLIRDYGKFIFRNLDRSKITAMKEDSGESVFLRDFLDSIDKEETLKSYIRSELTRYEPPLNLRGLFEYEPKIATFYRKLSKGKRAIFRKAMLSEMGQGEVFLYPDRISKDLMNTVHEYIDKTKNEYAKFLNKKIDVSSEDYIAELNYMLNTKKFSTLKNSAEFFKNIADSWGDGETEPRQLDSFSSRNTIPKGTQASIVQFKDGESAFNFDEKYCKNEGLKENIVKYAQNRQRSIARTTAFGTDNVNYALGKFAEIAKTQKELIAIKKWQRFLTGSMTPEGFPKSFEEAIAEGSLPEKLDKVIDWAYGKIHGKVSSVMVGRAFRYALSADRITSSIAFSSLEDGESSVMKNALTDAIDFFHKFKKQFSSAENKEELLGQLKDTRVLYHNAVRFGLTRPNPTTKLGKLLYKFGSDTADKIYDINNIILHTGLGKRLYEVRDKEFSELTSGLRQVLGSKAMWDAVKDNEKAIMSIDSNDRAFNIISPSALYDNAETIEEKRLSSKLYTSFAEFEQAGSPDRSIFADYALSQVGDLLDDMVIPSRTLRHILGDSNFLFIRPLITLGYYSTPRLLNIVKKYPAKASTEILALSLLYGAMDNIVHDTVRNRKVSTKDLTSIDFWARALNSAAPLGFGGSTAYETATGVLLGDHSQSLAPAIGLGRNASAGLVAIAKAVGSSSEKTRKSAKTSAITNLDKVINSINPANTGVLSLANRIAFDHFEAMIDAGKRKQIHERSLF